MRLSRPVEDRAKALNKFRFLTRSCYLFLNKYPINNNSRREKKIPDPWGSVYLSRESICANFSNRSKSQVMITR